MGTVSGAWDLGIVVGSLVVGLVVERASHGAGFAVAAGLTLVALVAFVLAERARAR
jgi:predicted MFS family arabinose efflux permease